MNIPTFLKQPSQSTVIVGALVVTLLAIVVVMARKFPDPDFVFIHDRGGAEWVYHDYDRYEGIFDESVILTPYRAEFLLSRLPSEAVLEVQALRSFQIRLDGNIIRDFEPDDRETWKTPTKIDLLPYLAPGQHVLDIIVTNTLGPTAVWARCPPLDIYSGESWTANLGGANFSPVKIASAPRTMSVGRSYPHVAWNVAQTLPYMAPMFLLAFAFVRFGSDTMKQRALSTVSPSRVRWAMLGLLLLLGLNNMFKVTYTNGFDAFAHYDYIEYVADNLSIPLAHHGWQMFQSPLFYMIAAPVHVIAVALTDWIDPRGPFEDVSTLHYYLIRIVPVLLGLGQVELSYRMGRLAWPDDKGLQVFCTLFGSLIPCNTYMSQYVGNESIVGLTGGVAVLLGAILLKSDEPPSNKMAAACGVALGLALLSKVSALLLVPPCFLAFTSRFLGPNFNLANYAKKVGVVSLCAFLVCGWYYLRNYYHLGQFFVGGWDPLRKIEWWQAPGYRMWHEYARFGEAMAYPLYSGMHSVWDGIYTTYWLDGFLSGVYALDSRPPWNGRLLAASAWLAMLPMVAILLGTFVPVGRMLARPKEPWTYHDRLQLYAASCVGIYMMAIVYMHLQIPIFSGAKGSYMSSIKVVIAYLATRAYAMMRNGGALIHAGAFAWFACWFYCAYATYFIVWYVPFDV